jgi:hypothetical protein
MGVPKFVAILLAVLLGAAFLYSGVGGEIPLLEYKGAKAYGIPIGIVFLVLAVLLGKYWVPSSKTTHTTEKIDYGPASGPDRDDGGTVTRSTTTIEKTFGNFEP